MDQQMFNSFYDYHHWATSRLLAALATLSQDDIDRPLGGSFGSIGDLVRHMLGADTVWLERWHGNSPAALPDVPTWRSAADFERAWAALQQRQLAYIGRLADGPVTASLQYRNLKGESFSTPLGEVLLHVVNHGTYHRGQLAHMLRQVGARPPSTDYVQFVRERGAAPARGA